jgi:hypothetical protein
VAFSPDGKTVLTARLWEAGTGKPIGAALQHQGVVVAVAFSPDGKTVLTARLWEAGTGKPIGAALQHQGDVVGAVAFSPDSKTVLTGCIDRREGRDYTARLWRLPQVTGDPERVALWAQVLTGIDLDEHGEAIALDAATWQQRRQRLERLGDPPLK